jgi:hypothetical protein
MPSSSNKRVVHALHAQLCTLERHRAALLSRWLFVAREREGSHSTFIEVLSKVHTRLGSTQFGKLIGIGGIVKLRDQYEVLHSLRNSLKATRLRSGVPGNDEPEKLVVLEVQSGIGLFSMFLSEYLPASRVLKIVLIDKRWPVHGLHSKGHHLSSKHLLSPLSPWTIPLEVRKCDLKNVSYACYTLRALRALDFDLLATCSFREAIAEICINGSSRAARDLWPY